MNSCRWKSAWILAGTAVLVGIVGAQAQQAIPSGGRKIEFSDPGGTAVASNLNSIANGKTTLPKFDFDLKKPDEVFQSGSSLQGVSGLLMMRTPASAVNSKKLKELLEKQRDWQFLDFEDYHSEQTIEGMLGIPEYGSSGELKEEKSPLERYYERLERANAPATNRAKGDNSLDFDLGLGVRKSRGSEEPNLHGKEEDPHGIAEAEDPLKQLLRGNLGNSPFPDKSRSGDFPGIFGKFEAWKPESLDAKRAQAARLEEFKRTLDPQYLPALPSSSVSGITPFDPYAAASSASPLFNLPRGPKPTSVVPVAPLVPGRDSFSPVSTTVGALAGPLDLPVAPGGNQNLLPAPTPLEPTRTVVPTSEFNIPKRRF